MDRAYLRPGWLLAHAVVAGLAALFVMLGIWQLDRLEQRLAANQLGEERFSASPAELADVYSQAGESVEYRQVAASGVFDPDGEVLIRSQVHRGTAGFHVITPLVGESGESVLVNRGWVPLGLDRPPITEAPPPAGSTTVRGWAHPTQERPALGPEDPPTGVLEQMNRVDVDRIQAQLPYEVASFYLVELADRGNDLPAPVSEPRFDDKGPHLAYAIQWFGFALVLVVGWVFLVRRQMGTSSQEPSGARASPSTISKPSSPSN